MNLFPRLAASGLVALALGCFKHRPRVPADTSLVLSCILWDELSEIWRRRRSDAAPTGGEFWFNEEQDMGVVRLSFADGRKSTTEFSGLRWARSNLEQRLDALHVVVSGKDGEIWQVVERGHSPYYVRRMAYYAALVAIVALACAPAHAQRTPVYQTGLFGTSGNIVKFYSNGLVGNGSGLVGDVNGRGVNPFAITDGLGLGLCSNSTVSSAAYYALCLGHDADGNALLTIDSYGGAAEKDFIVRKNGTSYSWPGSGAGTVQGPVSTVARNIPVWNNTAGTLLADSGLAIASGVGLNVYVSKAGADVGNCQTIGTPCLTIAYALTQGLPYDVKGGNLTVNFQGVGDWAEDIFINGPLRGAINKVPIPSIGSTWGSMVYLLGNGASNTTLSGSGGYCATVAASQYAIVGLRNLTVTGTKNVCHSPVFAQMAGIIHIFGGNVVGPATLEIMHAENPGSSIQIWENYTLSGAGSAALSASDHGEILISAGVGTIAGAPTYTSSFLFLRNQGSIQSNIAAPWGAAPVATGQKFQILTNSVLEASGITTAQIPGSTPGMVTSGGRVRGPISATIGTQTGLDTGTAALTYGTPYAGVVTLSPTGTPAANGTSNVTIPYFIASINGSEFGVCTASVMDGTGLWVTGALVQASMTSQTNIKMNWSNASTILVAGSTYKLAYQCQGD